MFDRRDVPAGIVLGHLNIAAFRSRLGPVVIVVVATGTNAAAIAIALFEPLSFLRWYLSHQNLNSLCYPKIHDRGAPH